MDLNAKIREMAESRLGDGLFLVDLLLSEKRGPKKLTLFIDGDNGATIEDCANLSRSLGEALDDANLIDGHYTLEVSTPGVDFPLKLKRQYKKNIGRNLKLILNNKQQVKGKLAGMSENAVTLEQKAKEKNAEIRRLEVPFADIEKALVEISFK